MLAPPRWLERLKMANREQTLGLPLHALVGDIPAASSFLVVLFTLEAAENEHTQQVQSQTVPLETCLACDTAVVATRWASSVLCSL